MATVSYMVSDVDSAIAFYTEQLVGILAASRVVREQASLYGEDSQPAVAA